MKRHGLAKLIAALTIIVMLLTMSVACDSLKGPQGDKGDQGIQGPQGEPGKDGKDGVDGVSPSLSISDDGYWIINGIKTWYKASGTDGKDGQDGITPTIEISSDGYWIINGVQTEYKAIGVDGANGTDGKDGQDGAPGKDGEDGKDGITPTIEISSDGYWIINGVKTKYKAIGTDGTNGTDGKDGVDGAPGKDGQDGAPGKDGEDGKDGVTPTIEISADGYWIINGVKTEYKAIGVDGTNGTDGKDGVDGAPGKDGQDGAPGKDGEDGKDGITPTIEISADGYWIINGVKTEYKAIGTDGAPGQNGTDGKPGEDGVDGAPGKDGVDGITPTFKLEGGDIWVSYDDGITWENLGHVNESICHHRDADDNYYCDYCANPYSDGVDVPADPEHTHSYGDWRYYGTSGEYCEDALFYRTCPGCNVIEWRDGTESDHKYTTITTTPTCTNGGYDTKTCAKCEKKVIENQTDKVAHNYASTYSFDATYHWKQCTYCADVKDKAEHIINGDGFCIVCVQPLGPTEGIIYDYSLDGTYAEVLGYEGNATQIVIADTYMGLPVKTILKEAFYDNDTITSVLIPDSVTEIGDQAFSSCSKLTSVVIPDSVTTIGDKAFIYCINLTSVVIGDSVTTIGGQAFSNCSKLTSVTMGNGVTSIDPSAFSACNAALYTEYEYGKYVGDASNPYAVLYGLTNKNFTTYAIHEDTKYIAYGVFESCARLTNITIPDSVKSIGDFAFRNCNNLTSVVIPDSVTTIGDRAFDGCSGLTSVVIGDSVTTIGEYAFFNCESLETVYYGGAAEDWANISIGSSNSYLTSATRYYYSEAQPTEEGNFWHYVDGAPTVWVKHEHTEVIDAAVEPTCAETGLTEGKHCSVCGEILVAQEIIPMTETHTFGNWVTTKEATATEEGVMERSCICGNKEVRTIEKIAPQLAYSLNKDGESYTVEGIGTWTDSEIIIPDKYNDLPVTSIAIGAFSGQKTLTSITIGKNITTIGKNAFRDCYGISELNFNAINMSDLDNLNGVFFNAGATSGGIYIKIGSEVTRIPADLFFPTATYGASEHKVVGLSFEENSKCKTIGNHAFDYCSFRSISLPNSITSIGHNAFSSNAQLSSIKFDGTIDEWKAISKSSWIYPGANYTIYCSDGSIAKDGTITYS